jgi:hypothetical protein
MFWKRLAVIGLIVAFFVLYFVASIAFPTWIPSPAFLIAEIAIVIVAVVLFASDRLHGAFKEVARMELEVAAKEDEGDAFDLSPSPKRIRKMKLTILDLLKARGSSVNAVWRITDRR